MYPSKIILFGEYLVLNGADLIGVPFTKFNGVWSIGESIDNRLSLLAEYISNKKLDYVNNEKFVADIASKITFNSNIPAGYGCGSSGALIAAVYNNYVEKKEPRLLQKQLSELEAFYHGSSSGVDPLISFINKNLLFSAGGYKTIDTLSLENFYLFDSGQQRSAGLFVQTFLKKIINKDYAFKVKHLENLSNQAISMLIENKGDLLEKFKTISDLQLDLFEFAIPSHVSEIWKSYRNKGVYFKICGAGGGGYFLVYTKEPINEKNIIPLFK